MILNDFAKTNKLFTNINKVAIIDISIGIFASNYWIIIKKVLPIYGRVVRDLE